MRSWIVGITYTMVCMLALVTGIALESRKQEMIIPLRITVGKDHVKTGEVWVLLSNSERILGVITRTVSSS